MAFWGVEVKPGKPFTHKYDSSKGRLHISMATLGLGTATAKSTLQCNVGSRSPVYLCSLYPGNTESLQLNIEFDEVDQVLFSVIGPRSIHLCGHYLSTTRNTNLIDDSESYGEDIADTETEGSDYSDEDEYEDSFIDDDGVPEGFSPSPISKEEEASPDKKPKSKKCSLRRLRKKYLSVESDSDGSYEEKIIVNDIMHDQTQKIDNEDTLPISSLYKNKASRRVLDQEMDATVNRGAGDASNKNGEDGGNSIVETSLKADHVLVESQTHREAELSNHLVDPCTVLDVDDFKNLKKKKKRKEKETKSSWNGHSIKLDNGIGEEPKMEKMTQDFVAENKQQQHADDKETETMDKILPSTQVNRGGQGEKPKRKRKGRSNDGVVSFATDASPNNLVSLPLRNEYNKQHTVNQDANIYVALPSEADPKKSRTKRRKKEVKKSGNGYHENVTQEGKANRDAAELQNLIHNFFEGKELHQKLINEKNVDNGAHDFPNGNQSEDRKVKKRKKMSKSQGYGEVLNSDVPVCEERNGEAEMIEERSKKDAKPSPVRTFSNGLVIQELEKGIKDGKIAASGKKISIYYTGKLKENEVVFESNVGQAPFKFRLGKAEVVKGWDVCLEGMQVGGKRRLVIPPSLTSESDGYSAKIPSNSWLVYDFELVKVH